MTNRALRGIFEGRAGFLNSGTAFPFRSVRVEARAGGEGAARVVVESVDLSEYARLRVRGGDGADRLRSSSSSSGVRAGGGESEGDGEARTFPLPLRSDELEEEGLGREAGVEVAMVVLRVLRSPETSKFVSLSSKRSQTIPPNRQTDFLEGGSTARPLPLFGLAVEEVEDDDCASPVSRSFLVLLRVALALLLEALGERVRDEELGAGESAEGRADERESRAEVRVGRFEGVGWVLSFAVDDLDEDMD